MYKYRSKKFPRENSYFFVLQNYSSNFYVILFVALMIVMLYQLAQKGDIFFPGVVGIFLVAILSNYLGYIQMRRTVVEIGFDDDYFYVFTLNDVLKNQKKKKFPLPYVNFELYSKRAFLNYFDKMIELKQEDWQSRDWVEIKQLFSNY